MLEVSQKRSKKMQNKICLPELPLTGSCQCGAVRYSLLGAPIVFYICHCKECQKQSSSAFGESFQVYQADLEVTGEVKTYQRGSESGSVVKCEFCANCGTRLFHRRKSNPNVLNIKAGTLDNTSWLEPAGHIWTGSKQAWVKIPKDALAYKGQPDNYDALIAKWNEQIM